MKFFILATSLSAVLAGPDVNCPWEKKDEHGEYVSFMMAEIGAIRAFVTKASALGLTHGINETWLDGAYTYDQSLPWSQLDAPSFYPSYQQFKSFKTACDLNERVVGTFGNMPCVRHMYKSAGCTGVETGEFHYFTKAEYNAIYPNTGERRCDVEGAGPWTCAEFGACRDMNQALNTQDKIALFTSYLPMIVAFGGPFGFTEAAVTAMFNHPTQGLNAMIGWVVARCFDSPVPSAIDLTPSGPYSTPLSGVAPALQSMFNTFGFTEQDCTGEKGYSVEDFPVNYKISKKWTCISEVPSGGECPMGDRIQSFLTCGGATTVTKNALRSAYSGCCGGDDCSLQHPAKYVMLDGQTSVVLTGNHGGGVPSAPS